MSDTLDLKPCPFCGCDKLIICKTDYEGRDSFAVSCRYMECHGAIFTLGYGYFPTKDEAIAAWNTRSDITPVVKPLDWVTGGYSDKAASYFGAYHIINAKGPNGEWDWFSWQFSLGMCFDTCENEYPTIEQVKAAAQADHEGRVLSALSTDPAAIREAALREAAAAVSELADHAVTALAYEHAHACRDEILELIGEKK